MLTKHSEVDHVLPVARRKRGVLADVGRLVGQLQVGEHNGGVLHLVALESSRLLEAHTLLEGRQDGDAQGRVGGGDVMLGAVGQLLPGDLGDLHRRIAIDEDAAQFHLCAHKARLTGVHLYTLSIYSCTKREKEREEREKKLITINKSPRPSTSSSVNSKYMH